MKKLVFVIAMFGMLSVFGCSGGGSDDVSGSGETIGNSFKVEAGPDRIILSGRPLQLTAESVESSEASVDFMWDFGDGNSAGGKSVSHSYGETGQYTVMVTANTASGKSAFDTFTLKVIDWDVLDTPINAGGHLITNPMVAFLPDGRMVVVEGVDNLQIEVAVETAKGSKSFQYIMSINPEGGFSYPSFVKAADSNSLIIGASDIIYLLDLNEKNADVLASISNYAAALFDNTLYVTRFGYVSKINLTTKNVTDVITDITGYSGGICLDKNGNIYTGIGSAENETGHIRLFDKNKLPVKWSDGIMFADTLTADSLIYNEGGTIMVGGGDIFGTSGDNNYFCALDAMTGTIVFKLDPDNADKSSYKLANGGGQFAAAVWDWGKFSGVIYTVPFEALGL
jgi:PKD repeat protein